MALMWALRHDAVTSVLIGASRVAQIDDDVAALSKRHFTAQELTRIDAVLGQ